MYLYRNTIVSCVCMCKMKSDIGCYRRTCLHSPLLKNCVHMNIVHSQIKVYSDNILMCVYQYYLCRLFGKVYGKYTCIELYT